MAATILGKNTNTNYIIILKSWVKLHSDKETEEYLKNLSPEKREILRRRWTKLLKASKELDKKSSR